MSLRILQKRRNLKICENLNLSIKKVQSCGRIIQKKRKCKNPTPPPPLAGVKRSKIIDRFKQVDLAKYFS